MSDTAKAAEPLDLAQIKALTPFNELMEHQFQEAIKYCERITVPARKKLFKRGDQNSHWYYLLKGDINLINDLFEVRSVKASDPACVYTLDDQNPHHFSAITTSECQLLKVEKKRLDLAMTWEQAGGYDIQNSSDDEADWMSSLLESEVFANVPLANMQRLFSTFKNLKAYKDQYIIKEGASGDRFYVVASGYAQVTKRTGESDEVIANLSPGQFFGEEALIGETTRNASVMMLCEGSLMYLDKEDFQNLLEQPVLNRVLESELSELQKDFSSLEIVDVRLSGEYRHFHRENSVNIPLNKLRRELNTFNKECAYLVDDNAGPRSELGVYLLIKAGFHAYLLTNSSD